LQQMTIEHLRRCAARLLPEGVKERCREQRVKQPVPYDNAYHCCTQRTGSQMLRKVFADPLFHRYSGLRPWVFTQDPERVQDARIDTPLPPRTIGTNLYIDYPTFVRIPKPDAYKAFFVLRDPRDIVTSWYFSARYSHKPTGLIPRFREDLTHLDLGAGLKYSIDTLWERGLFKAQLSWADAAAASVRIFRYEHLADNQPAFLRSIFEFLGVAIPDEEFRALCSSHSFEANSGGRCIGQSDPGSHYRVGTAGDWGNYFDHAVIDHFRQTTTDLLERLGYSD
jgi:hypothetical protein